jgi:Zn-dependent peptidase ImmA (M78 family)
VPRRPSRAEQSALQLLEELWDGELPIDVEKIARARGVKLRYEPLEGDLSGVLYRADDGITVLGVNDWHSDRRQRFTIAHELAHLELHSANLYVDGFIARDGESSLAIKTEEIEANAFAAELLMPRQHVLEELSRALACGSATTLKNAVVHLAGRFDVSEQAMQFRLVNLGLATSF